MKLLSLLIINLLQKQSKLKYISWIIYIDKVIRGVHHFIDQNVYGSLGNFWNQSLNFIFKKYS